MVSYVQIASLFVQFTYYHFEEYERLTFYFGSVDNKLSNTGCFSASLSTEETSFLCQGPFLFL